MLETVREYASGQCRELGESESLGRRHRSYYVALAKTNGIDVAAPDANKLLGRNSATATARLAADFANVRQAVSSALASGAADDAGHVIAALFPFLLTQGHLAEARGWVEAVLADRERLSNRGLAATLLGGAEILRFAGDLATPRELKVEWLALQQSVPSRRIDLYVLADLCDIAVEEGDLELARRYADQSVAAGGGARAAASLALLSLRSGDLKSAETSGSSPSRASTKEN